MFSVIKKKGVFVTAYRLGSNSPGLKELVEAGKIRSLGDGQYEVFSQEALKGASGGEVAREGDWVKIDGSGCPYPNRKEYFETNHHWVEGDIYEQIPQPCVAWDANCVMCPEIVFLVEKKGLTIDLSSFEERYSAILWGTLEKAAADAVIVFYRIAYEDGAVTDAEFNFIERTEFERTYIKL